YSRSIVLIIPTVAIWPALKHIRIHIVKHFFLRIPLQWPLQLISNVNGVADGCCTVSDFHVGHRLAPLLDRINPILVMVVSVIDLLVACLQRLLGQPSWFGIEETPRHLNFPFRTDKLDSIRAPPCFVVHPYAIGI